jgi:flagellar protein FlgJ
MSLSLQSATVYSDLQSLDRLRYAADTDPEEKLKFVAQQFEAIFLQMMLKSAHPEGGGDELFGSDQTDFYQDWYDKQLAVSLSAGQGAGIAELLVKQLRASQSGKAGDEAVINSMSTPHGGLPVPRSLPAVSPGPVESSESTALPTPRLGSPDAFVSTLWPLAARAASQLGVAPEVLLAQAALETGWGQKILQDTTGRSSHNLFNIKADSRWQGERVAVATLEYRDGIAERERAFFRRYDSFESSFSDYVDFIKSNGRYQDALKVASDGGAYTRELAKAGYATDPRYAEKIMSILQSAPFTSVAAASSL